MSENDQQHSGSRWEPTADGATTPQPAAVPPYVPAAPAQPAKPRGRVAVAAAALGLVAAGGLGGFVLGQSTSSSADETGVVQTGVPGQGGTEGGTGQFPGGGRPDFDGDGDGDHGVPPGINGTAPDGSTDGGTTDDSTTDGSTTDDGTT